MYFFLPKTKKADEEASYLEIIKHLKDQLGLALGEQRIYKVRYKREKRTYTAEVGKKEEHENIYEIVAIYQTPRLVVVFTRTPTGANGVSILIDNDETLSIEEFSQPK